jgi:hypothetical protein
MAGVTALFLMAMHVVMGWKEGPHHLYACRRLDPACGRRSGPV